MVDRQDDVDQILSGRSAKQSAASKHLSEGNTRDQDQEVLRSSEVNSETSHTAPGTTREEFNDQNGSNIPVSARSDATNGLRHPFLYELLATKEYHPVMLFGSAASGKSTLLVSLFSYTNFSSESPSTCVFNEKFFDTDNSSTNLIKDRASQLFYKDMVAFHKGIIPERTQAAAPIFIPVEVKTRGEAGRGINLAFLESAGEHQQADERTGQARDNEFTKEVSLLYKNYEGALSIILVAPYQLDQSGYEVAENQFNSITLNNMHEADNAIWLSLTNYLALRPEHLRKNDHFRFIITKWDEYTKGPNSDEFLHPPSELVETTLSTKFPMSWRFFQNMPHKNVSFMHYSAGVIVGSALMQPPEKFKGIFDTFPKEIWRWIYFNALAAKSQVSKQKPRSNIIKRMFKRLFAS